MARRSGLGRGLDALIPSQPDDSPGRDDAAAGADGSTDPGAALRDLPIDAIRPNRFQPRHQFADADMTELTDSVRELGILQPLLVRATGEGGYELIAGERRWRAARAAGLTSVPAVVRDAADSDALEQALVENLQRADLNPIEEAVAYQQLVDTFALTQDAVAARVGKSRSAVANTIRLLQLTEDLQDLVRTGALSAGHARVLVTVTDDERRRSLAARAVADAWSVRQMEAEAKRSARAAQAAPKRPDASPRGAAVLELEQLLSAHLDTRVEVRLPKTGKGAVIVSFSGLDDLERIYHAMRPPAEPGAD